MKPSNYVRLFLPTDYIDFLLLGKLETLLCKMYIVEFDS